jgi:predicted ATPase with chaperone activity
LGLLAGFGINIALRQRVQHDDALPPVPLAQMIDDVKGKASIDVAARVEVAQVMQMQRKDCLNARLDGEDFRKLAAPDAKGRKLLDAVIDESGVTAMGFDRILRISRCPAD